MTVDSGGISVTAARWMMLGEWRAHPARILAAAATIAVGVALGFAVHLVNQSALEEFGRAVASVNGDADLQVRSVSPNGFAEGLYAKLAELPGVADASPVVEVQGRLGRNRDEMTFLGLDALRAARVTPRLALKPMLSDQNGVANEKIFAADALFLSDAALRSSGAHIGDTVEVGVEGKSVPFVIAGTLPAVEDDQRIAAVDIAAAQWRFGMLGHLQRVDLKLKDGVDTARLRVALAALLPPDAEIVSTETESQRTEALSRAYRVNLDMLALMALLTGAFLVYSAEAFSVLRRRPQFALLRVLGVERRALLAQILAEGTIIGIAGGAIGIAGGTFVAAAALRFLGGDLGGGYFREVQPHLVFAPLSAALFLALGVVAALVGSFVPAREVARAQPAVALKNMGDAVDPSAWPTIWLPLGLLSLGFVAALLPAVGGLPLFGYVSVGLWLAGGVAAMPLIVRLLLMPLQHMPIANPPAALAVKRLWGAPSQAAIALSSIVASTSLMIAMAIMVLSFRQSVDNWLVQILPADLYLRIEGDGDSFSPELQRHLAMVQGVSAAQFRKTIPLSLASDLPPVALLVEPIDRARPSESLPLIGAPLAVPQGATAVWLSEPAAGLYRHHPGEWMALPIAANAKPAFIAGIWRDYGRQQGAIAIDDADYTRLTGDALRSEGWITLSPGASATAVAEDLRLSLPPSLRSGAAFASAGEIRRRSLAIFDRTFLVTYLIEGVAILVGLAGVAGTFSATTLARAKEFGMLRHVGVTRRQIVAMLACEGALLGAIGVVAGILLGLAISQVLIQVVNPQSFHWTMETRIPFGLLAGVAAALIVASCGTALFAGRRALAVSAIKAVKEDW